MTAPATRTARVASELYVGGYVDGRQGAVVMLGDKIAHLTVQQCRHLARQLEACVVGNGPHLPVTQSLEGIIR